LFQVTFSIQSIALKTVPKIEVEEWVATAACLRLHEMAGRWQQLVAQEYLKQLVVNVQSNSHMALLMNTTQGPSNGQIQSKQQR
jgi:hypothetical protein